MSSINFNSAATQALRTLQSTNSALDSTQKRISTGLAIGEAKDNAAYWSISTTMQSDNKALSTVTDALGLGAATVDTAYQGLSAAKDVLNEIKSKLTAALGSNVDRTAIQAEIDSLQDQLKSIASSSTFSGENWLSVNSGLSSYSAGKTIVSSFTRDVAGNVSVGEIKFDSSTAVLFDANATATKKGILDTGTALTTKVGGVETGLGIGGTAASGNTSKAGLVNVASTDANYTGGNGAAATASFDLIAAGGFTTGGFKVGDTVSFDISLDGGVSNESVSMKITQAAKATVGGFQTALLNAINANPDLNGKVNVNNSGTNVTISTVAADADAKLRVSSVSVANGSTGVLGLVTTNTSTDGLGAASSVLSLGAYNVTNGAEGDKITVTAKIGAGGTLRTGVVTLTAAMLHATTGAAAFAADLQAQLRTAGPNTDFTVDDTTTPGQITIKTTANATGTIQGVTIAASDFDTTAGALTNVVTNGTAGADVAGTGTRAQVKFDSFEAVKLDGDDTLNLTFGGTPFSITKAKIDAAIPGANGSIASVDQFVTVLNSLAGKNYTASKNADGKLVLKSNTVGAGGTAVVSATQANKGLASGGSEISVSDINITDTVLNDRGATDADKRVQVITAYINVVNASINKVTSAATAIGSIGKRVELQQTFVQNLMDTIDKGISGLVDADMNEESTKLQALQVKQQLGVQALSIANQSAQNVLSLFRG